MTLPIRASEATLIEVRQALQRVELNRRTAPQHNWTATTDPDLTGSDADDESAGYSVQSFWFNIDSGELFICTDATTGAPIWKNLTAAEIIGGASKAFKTISPPDDNDLVADSASDTLHITESGGVTITGSGDDILNIDAAGSTHNHTAAEITSGLLALARGGTAADLNATGGASQVLQQSSSGAAITVGQLASSDLSDTANVLLADGSVPLTAPWAANNAITGLTLLNVDNLTLDGSAVISSGALTLQSLGGKTTLVGTDFALAPTGVGADILLTFDALAQDGTLTYMNTENEFWFSALVQATQLKSTIASGTAPLVIASTDVVSNLNADLLDGNHAAAFLTSPVGDSDITSHPHTGDVTSSGAGTTIAADAVTYAKMQNVSATDKLLGRATAGAGNVEEIALTAAGRALIDDATAGDQRTTLELGDVALLTSPVGISDGGTGQTGQTAAFDALSPTTTKGDLIVSDGSDNVREPVGTNDHVLTADSTQASGVKWAAAAGGGSGDVTAAANITNNALVRGDGGAKGIQECIDGSSVKVLIDDNNDMTGLNSLALVDEKELRFGAETDAKFVWDTSGTRHHLVLGLVTSFPATSGYFSIMELAHIGHANREPSLEVDAPTLRIWGADNTDADDWVSISHSPTGASIAWGSGSLFLGSQIGSGDVNLVQGNLVLSQAGATVDGVDISGNVLLADGTKALSADWDAGSHKITAEQLESDVAGGTAPLIVASTTIVANLNVEALGGNTEESFVLYAGRSGGSTINGGTDASDDLTLKATSDGTQGFINLGSEVKAGAHTIGFTLQTATGDGTTTIDWRLGNKFKFTWGAQADTFTFTAPSSSCNLILQMKQDGTGGRDATLAMITWLGTAPTFTDGGANKTIIVAIYYDGTTYWGQATAWET